jgi:hypothetical protein
MSLEHLFADLAVTICAALHRIREMGASKMLAICIAMIWLPARSPSLPNPLIEETS